MTGISPSADVPDDAGPAPDPRPRRRLESISLPGWERREVRAAWIALLAVGSAAVGALIVLATGTTSHQRTAAPATSVPGRRNPSSPAISSDPDALTLRQIGVQPADIAGTASVQIIPGGNRVEVQTTLDLCNGTFASEQARTARLQVVEADDQGNSALSTEAVLYQNPGATARAFTELRNVAAHCPASPVAGPNRAPPVQTRFNSRPDGSWPQTPTVDRLAYDFVSTDQQGQTQHSVAVYLRRGRVLLGVYFPQPSGPQPGVAGKTTIPDIVSLLASRLAALPDAVINRSVPSVSLSAARASVAQTAG